MVAAVEVVAVLVLVAAVLVAELVLLEALDVAVLAFDVVVPVALDVPEVLAELDEVSVPTSGLLPSAGEQALTPTPRLVVSAIENSRGNTRVLIFISKSLLSLLRAARAE